MHDVLTIAKSHRHRLGVELSRIDKFLEMAEKLFKMAENDALRAHLSESELEARRLDI